MTGTLVATLPGAWYHRVSARICRPGVSLLWLGEIACLIYSFYPSVAARKIVQVDLPLKYILHVARLLKNHKQTVLLLWLYYDKWNFSACD